MVTISNEFLTAAFSEIGAELKSLISDNREYIWNGDPAFWTGSSPVLFPICSGLKDDEFIYGGKTYTMPKHGFARRTEFEKRGTCRQRAKHRNARQSVHTRHKRGVQKRRNVWNKFVTDKRRYNEYAKKNQLKVNRFFKAEVAHCERAGNNRV